MEEKSDRLLKKKESEIAKSKKKRERERNAAHFLASILLRAFHFAYISLLHSTVSYFKATTIRGNYAPYSSVSRKI